MGHSPGGRLPRHRGAGQLPCPAVASFGLARGTDFSNTYARLLAADRGAGGECTVDRSYRYNVAILFSRVQPCRRTGK